MMPARLPRRIAIIYLVYHDRHVRRSVALLRSIADRMFTGIEIVTIVVDNADSASRHDGRWVDGSLVVGGDNRRHEFSGWERGYATACSMFDLSDDDLVLFANDTFDRHADCGYLDPLNSQLVGDADGWRCSVGYCDDLPREARLLELNYRWWFRSNFFIHPKALVDRLMPFCFPVRDIDIFSDRQGQFWNDSDLISENLKAYISCWLFDARDGRFPEYRLRWYRAAPLTNANVGLFRAKALCILSEHYMGARLANWRVPIVDFNVLERSKNRHVGDYRRQFLEEGAIVV